VQADFARGEMRTPDEIMGSSTRAARSSAERRVSGTPEGGVHGRTE